MERRGFIKISSLAEVGMMATKAHGNALSKLGEQSKLAEPKTHVRHGDYRLEKAATLFLPTWIRFYQPHVFHGNGIFKSKNDLTIFQFDLEGEAVTIGVSDGKYSIMSRIKNVAETNDFAYLNLILFQRNYHIQVGNVRNLKPMKSKEFVALSLDSEISIEHQKLNVFDLVYGTRIDQISAPENARILLISRIS